MYFPLSKYHTWSHEKYDTDDSGYQGSLNELRKRVVNMFSQQNKHPESKIPFLHKTQTKTRQWTVVFRKAMSYVLIFPDSGQKSYSAKPDDLSEPQGKSMAFAAHDGCHIHPVNNKYNPTQL